MTAWNALDYHRHSSHQQAWARELIGKLQLDNHEHVLDIGCGDGKVTAEIAAQLPNGRVVGIDLSADMVGFARENFPPQDHPNLSFAQADASSLDFEDEFDVVFSNAVLHWIRDHRPVLRGIARSMRSGGRALLQMGGKENAADVLTVLSEMTSEPDWREHFANFNFVYGFYSPEEYRPWLREAQLDAQRIELIPKDMVHETLDAFAGWLRTTWMPWLNAVPTPRREAFLSELVERYLQRHPLDAKGRAHVRMVRLEVLATEPVDHRVRLILFSLDQRLNASDKLRPRDRSQAIVIERITARAAVDG